VQTQPKEFVMSIAKPRKIILLVMAGKPVDQTIELLSQHMEVKSPSFFLRWAHTHAHSIAGRCLLKPHSLPLSCVGGGK
jgi:hypothetical protein